MLARTLMLPLLLSACTNDSNDGTSNSRDRDSTSQDAGAKTGSAEDAHTTRGQMNDSTASGTGGSRAGNGSEPDPDEATNGEPESSGGPDAMDSESDSAADSEEPDTTAPGAADSAGEPDADETSSPEPGNDEASTVESDGGSESTAEPDTAEPEDGTGTEPVPEPADAIAVVVGYGARRVRSADGVMWTDFQELDANGGDDNNLFRGVGYGNGTFVAVGGGGQGFTMISQDGITWTDENRDVTSWLADVVALGNSFVAAGGNGLRVRSQDGGKTWQTTGSYYSGHFRGIAAGDGIAVAVGHSYGGSAEEGIISATDGEDWTDVQVGGEPFGEIAFGNGVFVAIGSGGRCSTSPDGLDWSTQTLAGAGRQVAFADGEFLIPGGDGLYHSQNGEVWENRGSESSRDVIGYFKGAFFSLGWPAEVSRSEDLMGYQSVFSPGGSGLTDMAVGVPGK